MRFVGALERVLDPIVAVLDALPAHFYPDHAPRDMLDLLSRVARRRPRRVADAAQRREMVRQAAELGRRRGTGAGSSSRSSLAFPELPLRVEDHGGGGATDAEPRRTAPPRSSCTATSRSRETQAGVARCIEQYKPVHTTYRLRVKAAKKKAEDVG